MSGFLIKGTAVSQQIAMSQQIAVSGLLINSKSSSQWSSRYAEQ